MLPVKSLTKAPIRNELLMEHHANPAAVACSPPQQQCVLVLVGPPGSGKSTLAALLQPDFHRISQDVRAHNPATVICSLFLVDAFWLIQVLGSRGKCLAAAEAAMLRGCSVVIDRCNFDAEQRGTWVCRHSTRIEPFFCLIHDAFVSSCFVSGLSCYRLGHNMSASGSSSAAYGCACRRHHP